MALFPQLLRFQMVLESNGLELEMCLVLIGQDGLLENLKLMS